MRIKSLKKITVDRTPVYDIEVDHFHNFVLANGVVVHNSKDGADALAGSAFLAYSSSTQPAMRNKDMISKMNAINGRSRIKERLFGRR